MNITIYLPCKCVSIHLTWPIIDDLNNLTADQKHFSLILIRIRPKSKDIFRVYPWVDAKSVWEIKTRIFFLPNCGKVKLKCRWLWLEGISENTNVGNKDYPIRKYQGYAITTAIPYNLVAFNRILTWWWGKSLLILFITNLHFGSSDLLFSSYLFLP